MQEKLITREQNALRFLMTEDIYLFEEAEQVPAPVSEPEIKTEISPEPQSEEIKPVTQDEITSVPEKEAEPVHFNYLGENNRYFLIIVDDKTHPEINNSHKEMLMKVMGAKGLEMRDLAILNLAKYPQATFSQLKDFFSCSKIALFGIDPQRISLPAIPANEPQNHFNVKILTSFSLGEMSDNIDKKKLFWAAMKDF